MTNIKMRPVTPEDMRSFYGSHERTVRALAVELEGELVCIAGVALEKGRVEAFSDLREPVNASKITVYRYARKIMQWIMELKLPVIVTSNPERENSHRFLTSLGFSPIETFDNITVYRLICHN